MGLGQDVGYGLGWGWLGWSWVGMGWPRKGLGLGPVMGLGLCLGSARGVRVMGVCVEGVRGPTCRERPSSCGTPMSVPVSNLDSLE